MIEILETHSERALPSPHIEEASTNIYADEEKKQATLALINLEMEAVRQGEKLRDQPMAGLVVHAAEHARASVTDEMTGLLNRRGLEKWFTRYKPERFGVLFADVINFKSTNDEYGEAAGDKVIAYFGQHFQSKLRIWDKHSENENRSDRSKQDVIGIGSGISRWGGDETLAVVDLSSTEPGKETEIMEKIQSRLYLFGKFSDEESGIDNLELKVRSVFEIGSASEGLPLKTYISVLDEQLYNMKKLEKEDAI